MKNLHGCILLTAVLATNLVFTNCANDATDPNESEEKIHSDWGLYGNWSGENFEFVSQEDTTKRADLSVYGVSFLIDINADSTYSSKTSFLGQTIDETGIIYVTDTEITIAPYNDDSHSGTYGYTDEGVNIIIVDEEFDFNQDGTDEPAFLYINLVKY